MLSIMKTFLNVLYRRILYKIPLKFLLILLAVFGLLFAYSKADLVLIDSIEKNWVFSDSSYSNSSVDFICIDWIYCNNNNNWLYYNFDHWADTHRVTSNSHNLLNWNMGICTTWWVIYFSTQNSDNCHFNIKTYNWTEYTSLQCQSEYSLIPVSEVDSSYCQSNNLCPSWWNPSDCPNVWISNVWINDLFHPGAYNIVMNISDEIDWDYAYTNSWNNLNIDVVWYNVDYEAVQSVIDQQSYKPTQEDFNNLIAVLWPYSKIIIFFVFLFIVWAWIKKPFKSKKL